MKSVFVFAGLMVMSVSAFGAAPKQVDPDEYKKVGGNVFEKRTDGLVFTEEGKVPVLMGNGQGRHPLGPTYVEDFEYGDDKGALCRSTSTPGSTGWTLASTAGTACDTTCGQQACVVGLDSNGNADGAAFLACSSASADSCICQKTGLDLWGVCGANWEAGALGISLMEFGDGVTLAHIPLLEALIGPEMDAEGLDIAGDLAANDGVEILGGMFGASGRPLFPGVDPAFQLCVTFRIEETTTSDNIGTDDFWIGFRDMTAPNATFNSYNSYAVVGFDAVNDGWHTETEDDGGGTTTTDIGFTYSDGGTAAVYTEACVKVDDDGAVTYTIDGSESDSAVGYTFDLDVPVVPFMHYLHDTAVMDELHISRWEVSFQDE